MSSRQTIVCACGRRIEGREVLQHGFFMTHWQPIWVYVKYRCSRCKMLGEKLVDYKLWDDSVLSYESAEPAADEATVFAEMGQIEDDEVRDFGLRLSHVKPSDLDALAHSLT